MPAERLAPTQPDMFTTVGVAVERPLTIECDVFRCAGELDLATVTVLLDATHDCTRGVVLDFRLVSFMDSTGTGALLRLNRALVACGYSMCITGGGSEVRRVLELSGVAEVLGVT
jgi:anti-anti-sigma factor